ncbi:TniQ family protein [Roseomonas xinghualingensis]|uniref:TniQ family protein n=1 Tax=Roseomonas xinghualingensis TaxID=2986475 RepID=UPI0021F13765|nr:TniQ family protein [Roseomonas sp. SXEYE001]MCV4209749.1 TniQ family protein [Roseomonas sp. SXEYE001]
MTRPRYGLLPPGSRLVVRAPPARGESALGWVLRLSEANGYRRHEAISNAAKYRNSSVQAFVLTSARLAQIGNWCGFDATELDDLGTVAVGRLRLRLPNGMLVSTKAFDRVHPRACPACLREGGILRAAWDLQAWIACPVHACQMLECCPGCGKRLTWLRRSLVRCCDGHDFMSCETPAVPSAVTELMRTLAPRIGEPSPPACGRLEALLSGMRLEDVLLLLGRLGTLALQGGEVPVAVSRARSIPLLATADVVAAAAILLANWPISFHEAIDRASDSDAARQQVDVGQARARIRRGLLQSLSRPAFAGIRAEFDHHGETSDAAGGGGSGVERFVSLRQARIITGLRTAALCKLIHDGGIRTKGLGNGKRFRNSVPLTEALRIGVERGADLDREEALRRKGLVTGGQAAALLGIWDKGFTRLVSAGLLPGARRVDIKGLGRVALFGRCDIDALLRRIGEPTQTGEAGRGGASGTLLSFVRTLRTDLSTLLRRVLDARLAPVAPVALDSGVIGLKRFLFSRAELDGLLASAGLPRKDTMTEREAMARLAVSTRTLKALLSSNLIRRADGPGPDRGRRRAASGSIRLSSESVEAFLVAHVTTGHAARECGMAIGEVAAFMRRLGVAEIAPGCWLRVPGVAAALAAARGALGTPGMGASTPPPKLARSRKGSGA